ncbi:hypothetical protein VNO78_30641 [Psophocarpus tetragonolobus]|uniref:Uncharacterized protein n=1 Tax=Psophocarpus tetragonolobus TaxID=3891 RepID=A0AAN9RWY7_PSOTE
MDASASGSRSGSDKGKEIDSDLERRKKIWMENNEKFFQRILPVMDEDQRQCRLIAAQYAKEENYKGWLQNWASIQSDDIDEYVWQSELNQQEQLYSASVEDQQKCRKMAREMPKRRS